MSREDQSGAYVIRRMTAADVDQVYALEVATFPDPWSQDSFREEMEQNRCARYLVAERDGRIVAYAGAWMIMEEGHITNVAVAASERGKGLGKAITAALMQYAANLGVQYMTLEVRKSNGVAQGLYEGLGFAALGVRKRYYENNGEDALLMVCQKMPQVQEEFEE